MNLKSEKDLINIWNMSGFDNAPPVVSIYCLAYNHENFIEDTLLGFLSQETRFPFEIVIHDDASTDNTADIIRSFEKQYLNIIHAIYEEENQYSKGAERLKKIISPHIKGKYVAFCEGDDYWCDNYKLKKQFEFMEAHRECSLCCHNTKIHDLTGRDRDKVFFRSKNIRKFTFEEIFFDWNIHTSSYFCRRDAYNIPDEFTRYWCGDFVRLTFCSVKGDIIALPDIMSVYNRNNKNGITFRNNNNIKLKMLRENERIEYLEKLNTYTDGKYKKIITKKIHRIKFTITTYEFETLDSKLTYCDYRKITTRIKRNNDYIEGYKFLCLREKIHYFLKYNSYLAYQINKKIIRKAR